MTMITMTVMVAIATVMIMLRNLKEELLTWEKLIIIGKTIKCGHYKSF